MDNYIWFTYIVGAILMFIAGIYIFAKEIAKGDTNKIINVIICSIIWPLSLLLGVVVFGMLGIGLLITVCMKQLASCAISFKEGYK